MLNANELARLLFAFGASIVLPLGLSLTGLRDRSGRTSRLFIVARIACGLAALTIIWSFITSDKLLPQILSSAMFGGASLLVLAHGVQRFAMRPAFLLEEVIIDAALACLPICALWFAIHQMRAELFGFGGFWALLTALHFLFAGFGTFLIVGLAGRIFATGDGLLWRWYRLLAVGLALALPLLALGIASHGWLETFGAAIYVACLPAFGFLVQVRLWRERPLGLDARALVWLSALCVFPTMALAAAWAFLRSSPPAIETMVRVHGVVNAFGFVGLGLLGFGLRPPPSRAPSSGIPFSHVFGRTYIGPDFLRGVRPILPTRRVGLVDDLGAFARRDFNVATVKSEIRRFYEQTADYEMEVIAEWQPGFRKAGRIWRRWAERIGQLGLPRHREVEDEDVEAQIVDVDESQDGRPGCRGWIRKFRQTGHAIYIAIYAEHEDQGQRYMNIAFPLPFSNLTSILRYDHAGEGIALTTRPYRDGIGDEGIYLVTPIFPVRLPIDETILVWGADSPPAGEPRPEHGDVVLAARHDMWLFGILYLKLRYAIRRRQGLRSRVSQEETNT